ncbi:MAG: transcriptional regulator [Ignavibacteria bacterium]|nr:transcriptional regulator [Ignavibacteriales bacterium]MBN8584425.1 transcriptional regulator [Ignavibacteria bacterium]
MTDFNYHEIDDVIHSRIRTAIMAVLISVDEAEFTFIREKINATDGNLSVHLKKLEDNNYISVKKEFIDRKPVTRYKITETGRKAFEDYIKKLESIIKR